MASTTSNFENSFTDTLAVFAEYISKVDPLPDSSFAGYTFSSGFVHGADGQYIYYDGDSARFRGYLRPDSVSLAAYSGKTIYIAFVANSHDDNLMFLDDIKVYSPTANGILNKTNSTINLEVFPNPVSNTLKVNYRVEHFSKVNITITNLEGKLIKRFDNGQQMTGSHSIEIDLSGIPQGQYFVQVNTNYSTQTTPITVIK